MNFKEELAKAMSWLGDNSRTILIGQSVAYPGHLLFSTLEHIPMPKRIELPVTEEMQMGLSIGLALEGFIPVSIYPRIDFLILASNQLVNHLDKVEQMSHGEFAPKVIIRTMIGSISPLNPGPQHSQDHTEALRLMLTNTDVVKLTKAEEIVPAYQRALESPRSTILVEAPPRRQGYDD